MDKVDPETGEILAQLAAEGQPLKAVKLGRTTAIIAAPPAPLEPSPQTLIPLSERPRIDFAELVQWILAHPGATHAEISTAYGRPAGWFSTVLVLPEFQAALEPFRGQVTDPAIVSTIQERLQALMLRSVDVLHTKLSNPNASDAIAIEAGKLASRALGLGNPGREAPPAEKTNLESLADRLTALIVNRKGQGIGSVPAKELVEDVTPKVKGKSDGS